MWIGRQDDATSSIASASSHRVRADLTAAGYVVESSRNEMLGGLPPAVSEKLAALAEVDVASRLRYGHWKAGSATSALTAVDTATLPEVTDIHLWQRPRAARQAPRAWSPRSPAGSSPPPF